MPPRIPPLLQPYIHPAQDSLTLLTGVLGAGTNWLVVKYICAELSSSEQDGRVTRHATGDGMKSETDDDGEMAVVLVSWMRDWEFWKGECRRSGGLDLARLAQQKRFAFVDGLTKLYMPAESGTSTSNSQTSASSRAIPQTSPSTRQTTLPIRQPPLHNQQPQTSSNPSIYLTNPTLSHLTSTLTTTLTTLSTSNVLLILDNIDLLLATSPSLSPPFSPSSSQSPSLIPLTLLSTLTTLRTHPKTHSTLLTLSSDLPLLSPASSTLSSSHSEFQTQTTQTHTPLETAHANFLVSVAHRADMLIGVRMLDTGVAGDVSGVLRISREVGGEEEGSEGGGEMEVLYRVLLDGSVRVFERGVEGGG